MPEPQRLSGLRSGYRQVSSERRASEWRLVKCSDRIVVGSLDPLPYKASVQSEHETEGG
jgi:hypothetical protein